MPILIDGNNFYFRLKDLGLHSLLSFNFSKFIKYLARESQIIQATYHVGAVRTDGTIKMQKVFNNQRRLLASLKSHKIKYQLGYLLKSDGKFHEKGVDVHIAVDMLVATYENLCNRIILVSSDTDLLPAIKKARDKGKIVEYIGFSNKPSLAMVANSSESRLLKKEDLVSFLPKATHK